MNLVDRAKKIILQPKQEWQVIAAEPQTLQSLYTQYVMILAAIPAVAAFIGFSLIGMSGFGASYRIPIAAGVAHMIVSYVLSLGMVYVLALVIDALAPTFGGTKNFMQALKVAAFAPTASWLAGIFYIIPALGILAVIGGLYSLYLLYAGLSPLMKTAEDKSIPYTVVIILAAIVLTVVVSFVSALVIPSPVRGF
jgi:Yip1-like protein